MPSQQYPSVNGHESSWADIGITFNVPGRKPLKELDWEGIKHSRKVEVGKSKGTSGGRTIKQTAGEGDCDASCQARRSAHIALLEELEAVAVALGGRYVRGNVVAISGVGFDVSISHTPLGDSRIYEVRYVGCRFLGDANDMKQGNEADMLDITLNPLEVLTKSSSGRWIALI